jgi:hypothetical protein
MLESSLEAITAVSISVFLSVRAFNTWIVQYLPIILLRILQAL